jgi:hypothetical protein
VHGFDLIVNPIMDNSWHGGVKGLDFAPASRVAYNLNSKWAIAVEQYSDYGEFRNIYPATDQFQQIWGVVDHAGKVLHVEAGIGFGVTAASDKVTLKLMLSRDLNAKPEKHAAAPAAKAQQ